MKDSTIILILLLVLLYFMNSKKKVIEKHNPVFTCGKKYKVGSPDFIKCAQCHQGQYSEENPCPEHDQYNKKRGLTAVEVAAGVTAKDMKKLNSDEIDDSYEIDTTITEAPLKGYATDSEDNSSDTSSQQSTSDDDDDDDDDSVSGITDGGNQESTETAYSASVTGSTATTSSSSTTSSHPLSGTCKILKDKLEGETDTDEINKISQSWSNFNCN